MNDRTEGREALAGVLCAHEYALEMRRGSICLCGFVPTVEPETLQTQQDYHRAHLADAILASPQFARIIAEAEARALREAAKAWERGADRARGRNVTAWLRDRAALVAPGTEGLT